MNGKLIVIEGTDCSGKETQANMLVDKLIEEGYKAVRMSFPMYDSPTGKIIGACLLGKPDMCKKLLKQNTSFFPEGGGNIDYLTACNLYAADKRYNLPKILKYLKEGYVVILDRYIASNMAHRGGAVKNKEERLKTYNKMKLLECEINEMPWPDKTILLYLPYEYACILKRNREESVDEAERNIKYLKNAERAYLELSKIYNFDIVKCVKKNVIRSKDEINEDVYKQVKDII